MKYSLFRADILVLSLFRLGRHLPPPIRDQFYWWLFCRPFTHSRDPEHLRFLQDGKTFFIPSGRGYLLQGWVFGQGERTVVLSHGWQGSAASWHVLVPKLLRKGYRVIVYNAPGHHRRPRRSSLLDFSQGLSDVVETFGAHYLVGHSLGAMTVARVAPRLEGIRGIALFSVPDELHVLATGFCEKMQMSEEARTNFLQRLTDHTPDGLEEESVTRYLAKTSVPVLLLHDDSDTVIPHTNSERLAQAYGWEFVKTSELGHRKIIRDPQLADRVVEFLDSQPL